MPKSLCLRIARTLGCIRLDKQLDLLLSAFQIDLAVCFVFPVVFPDHRKAEQIHIKMSGALIIASDDRNVVNFFGQSAALIVSCPVRSFSTSAAADASCALSVRVGTISSKIPSSSS